MEGNVLTGTTRPSPTAPSEPQRVINLVSNAPANKIVGLNGFLRAFNSAQVRAEIVPFRYVIQRKVRRSLGGKFGKGLSQEVNENIEVNPNEDLFGLRRWLGGIRQDPASVMLVNINKISLEALAAPLVFSDMIRSGRPILVTGADGISQDQLLSPIDLSFASIPTAVANNPALKESLVTRIHRRKGFLNSVRSVLELEILPKTVQEKATAINAGADPARMEEAEVVNLCLLGDLMSRYMPSITQFKEAVRNSSLQVPQLVSMFEILTSDLGLGQTVETFKAFYMEDIQADLAKLKSRGQVFGEVYRYLQSREGATKGGRAERMDEFFRRLASLVIAQRAKADPVLWRHCHFLADPAPAEQEVLDQLRPYLALAAKMAEGGAAAITPDAMGKLGEAVFELAEMSNQEAANDERASLRRAIAARLLPLFRLQKFPAASMIAVSDKNRDVLLNKEKFLSLFRKMPATALEMKELVNRLKGALMRNEIVCNEVRRTTLDVLVEHAKDRERMLRDIYILNAVPELVHFGYLLGDVGVNPVERTTALTVAQARLGLEMVTQPNQYKLIALCMRPDEQPLGRLQNDPDLVSRAYSTLIGLRIDGLVRRVVDHKINYLQSTFGENFFEVIYEAVVGRNDLPLSRNQLAAFIQRHNLLGNLQARGWKKEQENDLVDEFLTLDDIAAAGPNRQREPRTFPGFEKKLATLGQQFTRMMADLRASADRDNRRDNPAALVWGLYEQGIYNLNRAEAKDAFRKSVFYDYLKELIAQISSENYSTFTREIQQQGVKLYIPSKYFYFLSIGSRFSFLLSEKVVRYQLIATPKEKLTELDGLSRVFMEKLDERFGAATPLPDVAALNQLGDTIKRCNLLWWEYSRHLCFALVDRILTETIIRQLQPGAVAPQNLWFLPDDTKLCLGPALVSTDIVPFQKILQAPENMGNLQKNPKATSTTIDDFSIEVHKIGRLREELENIAGIAEDVLDILQNLTHGKADGLLVQRYEQNLEQIIQVLNSPLRHYREQEVQTLHDMAKTIKETLRIFYQTPGSAKDLFVSLLQNQLRMRRSDGHLLKLTFTDPFILEKTEITVVQKPRPGEGAAGKQKRVEVEVDSSYQTLATRVREVIRTHEVLESRAHIVLAPEGQKKKQIEYVLGIIDTLLVLRGNAVTFYCDYSMIDDAQMQQLATRIKPHNFFKMDELKPEPPKGIAVAAVKDPLSGRTVMTPQKTAPAETILTAAGNSAVRYRYDAAANAYAYLVPGSNEAVPARVLPVALGGSTPARILVVRLASGKFVFHGVYGSEILLPAGGKPEPPTICTFAFLDRTVRIVNDGGRPVVQIDQGSDSFVDELRSIN